MAPRRAVAIGCAILVLGMVILATALQLRSLVGLIIAAAVAGTGQGISFSRGLAAVAELAPPTARRGQFDVLRRGLRRDLAAGGGRGTGRAGLGLADCRRQLRHRDRRAVRGVSCGDIGSRVQGQARYRLSWLAALASEFAAVLHRAVDPRLLAPAIGVVGATCRVRLLAFERLAELALLSHLRVLRPWRNRSAELLGSSPALPHARRHSVQVRDRHGEQHPTVGRPLPRGNRPSPGAHRRCCDTTRSGPRRCRRQGPRRVA